jgi:hypothetical protein
MALYSTLVSVLAISTLLLPRHFSRLTVALIAALAIGCLGYWIRLVVADLGGRAGLRAHAARLTELVAQRRTARRAWAEADSLADLRDLTARWLTGDLSMHPGHCGPPDPETAPMIDVLAAANRRGLLTIGSQPGACETGPDGTSYYRQRGTVIGLADTSSEARLRALASQAGLHYVAARTPRRRCARIGSFAVDEATLASGRVRYQFEPTATISRRELAQLVFPACGERAVTAAQDAFQVSIVDPQWGPSTQLPAMLAAFAATDAPR